MRTGLRIGIALGTIALLAPASAQATLAFEAQFTPGVGATPLSVAIGDLNGDGRPDLATANAVSNNVSVLLGNGNGTFGPAANYDPGPAGPEPTSVAIGDLNGDGRPDLAVANSAAQTVSVLRGNGDGTFVAGGNFFAGTGPRSVAIGDLNGDGRPDLAVANEFSNNVTVLFGNSVGSFGGITNYPTTGTAPHSVAIGNLNGDARPDLAVANANSDNVSVLLGSASVPGTFAAAVNYPVGDTPHSVAIGEFNANGRLDLAVANAGSNDVSVLLGSGNLPGTFAAAVNYPAGQAPTSVAISDLNSDGRPDLATANANSANVSVLLGNANGTFAAAANFATGTNPRSVAIGDLDRDGRPDLATTNLGASNTVSGVNNVSILLNRSRPTVSAPATSFGSQMVGQPGSARPVVVTNTGNAPLQISASSVAGSEFNIAAEDCEGESIRPGLNCKIYVSFTPSAAGTRTASLLIDSNAVPGTTTVSLSGVGLAATSPTVVGAPPTCAGTDATVVGTPGNDVITGTAGNDTVVLYGGDDTFKGLGGVDRVCSGSGDDEVRGGGGVDTLRTGSGDDFVRGGVGNDTVVTGVDDDELYGDDGNDSLRGGSGDDLLEGGASVGTTPGDTCNGGSGTDSDATCETRSNLP